MSEHNPYAAPDPADRSLDATGLPPLAGEYRIEGCMVVCGSELNLSHWCLLTGERFPDQDKTTVQKMNLVHYTKLFTSLLTIALIVLPITLVKLLQHPTALVIGFIAVILLQQTGTMLMPSVRVRYRVSRKGRRQRRRTMWKILGFVFCGILSLIFAVRLSGLEFSGVGRLSGLSKLVISGCVAIAAGVVWRRRILPELEQQLKVRPNDDGTYTITGLSRGMISSLNAASDRVDIPRGSSLN